VKPFLPLALLAILPYANAQTVTVVQPDVPSLQLIGSQSPDFATAAAAIVSPQTLQQLAAALPLAVVLKNGSAQPLIGYRLRWAVGATMNQRSHGMGTGMFSPKSPDALQPGAAVLFVPGFLLTHEPSPEELQRLLQAQSSAQYSWPPGKTIGIGLDSVILASGQFLGPDVENNFAHDVASSTAWRSVDANVQAQIANGVPFVAIAAGLQQIRDQPISAATTDWTARVQSTEARQLIKLYDRSGAQAVADRIHSQLALPEITVHR
jgi:hypothetical protein